MINVERFEQVIDVFGSFDENIRLIESQLSVSVVSRDNEIKVSGEAENVMLAVNGLLLTQCVRTKFDCTSPYPTTKSLRVTTYLGGLFVAPSNAAVEV